MGAAATPQAARAGWGDALRLFKREQPFIWQLPVLLLIIPLYMVIAWEFAPGRTLHEPVTAVDRMLPLLPAWSVVYGSLFLAALLPVFVVHQPELLRRTVIAYLAAWLTAYAFFLAYPTVCPRPAHVEGDGFAVWALRAIYASDPKYNCFPSLHVAQCFIAALACSRVNRALGMAALCWASLVALSTLFTKQHYVADVVGGIMLAFAVCAVGLLPFPRGAVPEIQQRLAPRLALAAFGAYGGVVMFMWLLYVT